MRTRPAIPNLAQRWPIVAGLLLILLAGSCHSRTVETPYVAGRVVDERTGQPVPGADVMVFRMARSRRAHGPSFGFGARWQTTGPDGRFEFPPSTDEKPARSMGVDPRVRLHVMHPDYGYSPNWQLSRDPETWGRAMVEIAPDAFSLELMKDVSESGRICGGLGRAGVRHCCEVVYDDPTCGHEELQE